jgi:Cft2 family RNA processing exonuclease
VLPTKLASEDREIEVRCRVVYIDMEGLSDGRSIKNLISKVGPKQLVIVGGGSSAVNALENHAREKRAYGKVTVDYSLSFDHCAVIEYMFVE